MLLASKSFSKVVFKRRRRSLLAVISKIVVAKIGEGETARNCQDQEMRSSRDGGLDGLMINFGGVSLESCALGPGQCS